MEDYYDLYSFSELALTSWPSIFVFFMQGLFVIPLHTHK